MQAVRSEPLFTDPDTQLLSCSWVLDRLMSGERGNDTLGSFWGSWKLRSDRWWVDTVDSSIKVNQIVSQIQSGSHLKTRFRGWCITRLGTKTLLCTVTIDFYRSMGSSILSFYQYINHKSSLIYHWTFKTMLREEKKNSYAKFMTRSLARASNKWLCARQCDTVTRPVAAVCEGEVCQPPSTMCR